MGMKTKSVIIKVLNIISNFDLAPF